MQDEGLKAFWHDLADLVVRMIRQDENHGFDTRSKWALESNSWKERIQTRSLGNFQAMTNIMRSGDFVTFGLVAAACQFFFSRKTGLLMIGPCPGCAMPVEPG